VNNIRIAIHKEIAPRITELVSYFKEIGCSVKTVTKVSEQDKPSIYIFPPGKSQELQQVKTLYKNVPAMVVTEQYTEEEELDALAYGASDYAVMTRVISLVRRIFNLIDSARLRSEAEGAIEVLVQDRDQTRHEVSTLQETLLSTVAEMVEFRDTVTGGHVKRTSRYLEALIYNMRKFGIYQDDTNSWEIPLVVASSMLHDVGKIKTTDAVLLKKDKLNKEEFEEIKQHTVVGANLLETIQGNMEGKNHEQYLAYAIEFARSHHEKWDGSGYPDGLKGSDIPLLGRLMSIVDVYDALVSKRSYKDALDPKQAEEIIIRDAGKAFDPLLIEVFKKTTKEFNAIREALEAESGTIIEYEADDTGVDLVEDLTTTTSATSASATTSVSARSAKAATATTAAPTKATTRRTRRNSPKASKDSKTDGTTKRTRSKVA
jgi:putative two-component system response regulator